MGQRQYNFDAQLEMKDAGLIAADAAWQVNAANQILDVGDARFEAICIIDITAIEAATDELYELYIQGSSSATFASDIQTLAMMDFGLAAARVGDITTLVGRYELPFVNEQNDITYRYIRGYADVTGTIATGINFTAFAAVRP